MSTCDFTVTLEATQQPITVKSDVSQCCTINVMNDVDITESSANNTVLVWDTEFNLWVRRLLNANNISGLTAYIANYLNTNDITFGANVSIGGTLQVPDIYITNDLTVDGDIILKGSTITLGDGGDVININATVNNHIIATSNNTYNLGSTTNYWKNLYVNDVSIANNLTVNNITVVANVDVTNVNTTNLYATDVDITANLDVSVINAGDINVTNNLTVDGDIILRGDTLTLGDGGDVININATVNNHIIPTTTNIYDFGSSSSYWRTIYGNTFRGYNGIINIGDCSTNNSIINLCGNVNFGTSVSVSNNSVNVGNVLIEPEICWLPPETQLKVEGVINLGDSATVNNDVVSTTGDTYDIGTDSVRWRNVYSNYYYGDGRYLDTITISKHQTEAAPASLANGQLHYSFSSDKLFIGQTDSSGSAVSVEYIGGKLLVDKVANLESVIATLSGGGATLANTIISGILTLSSYPENAALRTKSGGVVEAITGSSGEVFQVAANGSPYFDDLNGGTY
jgi:hypothetical protein